MIRMKGLNILFVLEYYYPHIGGVEVVFKSLAEGLAHKGHTVTVVTQRLKGTKAKEKLQGVNIIRLRSLNRYFFTFRAIIPVMNLAASADIIHTTTYNGAFPARIASFFRRKPCIITIHEVLGAYWGSFLGMSRMNAWLHRLLEWFVIHLGFSHYVCVSRSTKKQVLKEHIPYSKVSVVYNGVDYSFFDPKKYSRDVIRKKYDLEKDFVVLFFGRPGGSKGLEYLIRAIPAIKKKIRYLKVLCLVSKSRAYRAQYRALASLITQLGVGKDIILVDSVSRKELPLHIVAADCVAVPSLSEGFGFAAAESCALGIPVVASDTTSLPEVVSGKFVLVKPKNSSAIAGGITRVYRGAYTKSPLKKFLLSDTLKGYETMYRAALTPSKNHKV